MFQRLFVYIFVTERFAILVMKEDMWKLYVFQFQWFMYVGCCVWTRVGRVQKQERDRTT